MRIRPAVTHGPTMMFCLWINGLIRDGLGMEQAGHSPSILLSGLDSTHACARIN